MAAVVMCELTNQPLGFPVLTEIFRDICTELQFCICKEGLVVRGSDDPDCINQVWIPDTCIQFLQYELPDDQEIILATSFDYLEHITKNASSPSGSMSLAITLPSSEKAAEVHLNVKTALEENVNVLNYLYCRQGKLQVWNSAMRLLASLHLSSRMHIPTFELQKLIQLLGHAHEARLCIYPGHAQISSKSFRFKTSISVEQDGELVKTMLLKTDNPHSSCILLCERLLVLSRALKQLRQSQSCIVSLARPFLLCHLSTKAQACFSV